MHFNAVERALLISISMLLAGCNTIRDDPKNYQPSISSNDTGQVWLYRLAPRSTPGSWQRWYMDGNKSAEIIPFKYNCVITHVGPHIVRVGGTEAKVEFTLEKGQQIFIRFDLADDWNKSFQPVLVDKETAWTEFFSKAESKDVYCPAP